MTCVPKDLHPVVAKLRAANIVPTRQRCQLASLLLGPKSRHVTAAQLYSEARKANMNLSRATVYNALACFSQAGLIREIPLTASHEGAKRFFDTNTTLHHHFYDQESGQLHDIPEHCFSFHELPLAPKGSQIVGAEVLVYIRPSSG